MKAYLKKYPVQNHYLKDFVDGYYESGWIDESVPESMSDTGLMPPVGFPTIFFSVGNKTFNYNDYRNISLGIQGQQFKHFIIPPNKNVQLISVNFTPYGLYNLLGLSQNKIINSFSQFSQILNKTELIILAKLLTGVNSVEDGICIMENFIWERRIKKRKYPILFDDTVKRIIEEKGLNTNYIQSKCCSNRYLEYYFKNNVGYSPKFFCNLQRHKFILKQIFLFPDIKLTELVTLGNYYDYSHLSRDFKQFTGYSIADYRNQNNQFARNLILV
jgi:AraC-like DNA-binding protein